MSMLSHMITSAKHDRYYHLFHNPPEPALQRIANLATMILGVPYAAFVFTMQERRRYTAVAGATAVGQNIFAEFVSEPYPEATDVCVVNDPLLHPAFAADPLLHHLPGVRFYARIPLTLSSGYQPAALCIFHTTSLFSLTDQQQAALHELASIATDELNLYAEASQPAIASASSAHMLSLTYDQRQTLEMVLQNQPLATICLQCVHTLEHQHPDLWYAVLLLQDEQPTCVTGGNTPVQSSLKSAHLTDLFAYDAFQQACQRKEPFQLHTLTAENGHKESYEQIVTMLPVACWCVPVISENRDIAGAILLHYSDPERIGGQTLEMLALIRRLLTIVLDKRQLIKQVDHQSYHDPITGLPNRMLFEKRLQAALEQAEHSGKFVALLFIDLDRFKQVNDSLGHQIGDLLLSQVAARMQQVVPAPHILARLGGDEFACVMTDSSNPEQATVIAQKLLSTFQQPFLLEGHRFFLTANIGMSMFPIDGRDSYTLQRNADIAMYRVKRRGVNGIEYFTPDMHAALRDPLIELVEIEEHLRRASLQSELRLHYQPVFDLRQNHVVGAEALLRWEHPTLGLIPPGKFIPVTERIGLIRTIGAWVLRQACAQAVSWQRAGFTPFTIAVNVSGEQFAEPDFPLTVEQILIETGMQPQHLELELTESQLLADFEMANRHLAELKAAGVRIALDDFGTGHNALANLQRLPIDKLKIDQSFIQDVRFPEEQSQLTIDLIQTIVTMGRKLKMITVIEGIETEQQADVARRLQCDMAQGYWFGRPMPPVDFTEHLQQSS